MSIVAPIAKPRSATDVQITDGPDALDAIRTPNCPAVIWRRGTPPNIQTWLNDLPREALPHGRVMVPVSAVRATLTLFCDEAGLPPGPNRTWLEQDVAQLAEGFATAMQVAHLRVRLDVVETNACRKFHVDAIKARLVCTYRGTGTQYGHAPTPRQDPDRVFTVPTGSPILLRGTLWPTTPASSLVHRSPPIEGTGEARLVLVLDPVENPETEDWPLH